MFVRQAPALSSFPRQFPTDPQMLISYLPCPSLSSKLPEYIWLFPAIFIKGSRLNVVSDLGSLTAQWSPTLFSILQAAAVSQVNLYMQPLSRVSSNLGEEL